ncbi:MAG: YlmH/Sll1252 family protein [Oscillospiraceae bacterium]|nr:YlmH/Sll1252 family protein [Oscillospiraceae bacterium]
MNQHDLLLSRMEDLAKRAGKIGCAASKFLTPAEAQVVAEYFKHRKHTALILDGGFENAERVRAVFLNPDWGHFEREEQLSALRIKHRPQDSLGHRDILGAIMALGIERDTIGDIICPQDTAAKPAGGNQSHQDQAHPHVDESAPQPLTAPTLVCLPELRQYIIDNLIKAGRIGITVTATSLDELPTRQEEMTLKTDTVASLRLDAVLSAAFDLPRTKASELISAGRVSVNHLPCEQPAKELSEGTLLSVRSLGRAKLIETGGLSKKGRLFIKIGVY